MSKHRSLGIHGGPLYLWRPRTMAAIDGPDHDRLLATAVRAFTPPRAARP
jgi:hypothetical protein